MHRSSFHRHGDGNHQISSLYFSLERRKGCHFVAQITNHEHLYGRPTSGPGWQRRVCRGTEASGKQGAVAAFTQVQTRFQHDPFCCRMRDEAEAEALCSLRYSIR